VRVYVPLELSVIPVNEIFSTKEVPGSKTPKPLVPNIDIVIGSPDGNSKAVTIIDVAEEVHPEPDNVNLFACTGLKLSAIYLLYYNIFIA